jgi:hypothetical protein
MMKSIGTQHRSRLFKDSSRDEAQGVKAFFVNSQDRKSLPADMSNLSDCGRCKFALLLGPPPAHWNTHRS